MKNNFIASMLAVVAVPVFAIELVTGDEIKAQIAGNTVQGGMADGAAYTEFYDADGTIRAEGYTGKWTIENEQMCFDYGDGVSCLSIGINGDQVTWVLEGEQTGTGTIVMGNPNGF